MFIGLFGFKNNGRKEKDMKNTKFCQNLPRYFSTDVKQAAARSVGDIKRRPAAGGGA
jgi:hypothetical protein